MDAIQNISQLPIKWDVQKPTIVPMSHAQPSQEEKTQMTEFSKVHQNHGRPDF
jgi:hypothetical protein